MQAGTKTRKGPRAFRGPKAEGASVAFGLGLLTEPSTASIVPVGGTQNKVTRFANDRPLAVGPGVAPRTAASRSSTPTSD